MDSSNTGPDGIKDASPKKQFYRRPLPEKCISFSSEDGKAIFREAMSQRYMECYFKLAAQFRTQDEPAYCGLTTLVMVLNAFDIDPGRVWKGPWRWYHENMLDCCVPLHVIEKQGIDFDQFICVGNCNSLKIQAKHANESTENEFRQVVRTYTAQDNVFLILTYSRAVLGQTGDGHFSPVGGYNAEKDMVLLLDVARFKYPPHWVSLSLVWKAMMNIDKSTGGTRGYMIVSRQATNNLLVLFRLAPCLSATLPCALTKDVAEFLKCWQEWLSQEMSSPDNEILETAIEKFFKPFIQCGNNLLTTQFDLKCIRELSQEHISMAISIIGELEETLLFQQVKDVLKDFKENIDDGSNKKCELGMPRHCQKLENCAKEFLNKKCQWCENVTPSHFLSVFFLSWPYKTTDVSIQKTNAHIFFKHVQALQSKEGEQLVLGEIISIRKQFSFLLSRYKQQTLCKEGRCQAKCEK